MITMPRYLYCQFEDGSVYAKVDALAEPDEDYRYESVELVHYEQESRWELDEPSELTEEDLEEMLEDGFCDITAQEFEEAVGRSGLSLEAGA